MRSELPNKFDSSVNFSSKLDDTISTGGGYKIAFAGGKAENYILFVHVGFFVIFAAGKVVEVD